VTYFRQRGEILRGTNYFSRFRFVISLVPEKMFLLQEDILFDCEPPVPCSASSYRSTVLTLNRVDLKRASVEFENYNSNK
jgi:hypothetical protein